jgi:hypothetical protein
MWVESRIFLEGKKELDIRRDLVLVEVVEIIFGNVE